MNYTQIINNSRTIFVRNTPIENKFGRYWNTLRYTVPAYTDTKARLGKFTTPWESPLDPLFTMPELKFIPDKLSDIMDQRAIELNELAKSQNRKIMIMWSGGIDSTGVVTSFIKNIPTQDLDNITIVLSIESIAENPHFYEKFIQNKIKCMSYIQYFIHSGNMDDHIHLNGDPADCLFGPSISMFKEFIPNGDHLKPFKFNTKMISEPIERYGEYFNKKFNTRGIGTWYVQKVSKNLLSVNPDGVETISDWWWWHYINLKWEFSVWRSLLRRKALHYETEPLRRDQIEFFVKNTFYASDRFQQWSYSNLKNHIINNDVSTHKREIKQYIYDLDGNKSYFTQKSKVMSVPIYDHSLFYQVKKAFLIGNDWTGYYDNENRGLVEACRQRLEEFRG